MARTLFFCYMAENTSAAKEEAGQQQQLLLLMTMIPLSYKGLRHYELVPKNRYERNAMKTTASRFLHAHPC
jgi:hypothetical protein